MVDHGKAIQVRLVGDELNRLQQLADAHFDGNLAAALRSLVRTTEGEGEELVFRFSPTGAAYMRDLAKRRGSSVDDVIRFAIHAGCRRSIEPALAARRREVPADVEAAA